MPRRLAADSGPRDDEAAAAEGGRQTELELGRSKMPRPAIRWWHVVLIVLLLPVIVISVAAAALLFTLSTVCLHVAIWTWWGLRGRDILFVYSESPIWRDYVREHILPFLGERAIVLNWSERKRWPISLGRLAFYHFGGYRQFNPLAVVFRPFRRTRTFRFWEAFREFKHGHPAALHALELEFFLASGIRKAERHGE